MSKLLLDSRDFRYSDVISDKARNWYLEKDKKATKKENWRKARELPKLYVPHELTFLRAYYKKRYRRRFILLAHGDDFKGVLVFISYTSFSFFLIRLFILFSVFFCLFLPAFFLLLFFFFVFLLHLSSPLLLLPPIPRVHPHPSSSFIFCFYCGSSSLPLDLLLFHRLFLLSLNFFASSGCSAPPPLSFHCVLFYCPFSLSSAAGAAAAATPFLLLCVSF